MNFDFDRFTEVYESCSVLLSGKMWIFGGSYDGGLMYQIQLSSITDCSLKREGTLPQILASGAADIIEGSNGVESALLCDYHCFL